MSRMVVVTLPEDQVNQLEFLAKEESNRIGKEVTMTDLAERAVREQGKLEYVMCFVCRAFLCQVL